MAHLFEFSSSRFDPSTEPENPFNPIGGYAVLHWIGDELSKRGFARSQTPQPEDWGWYLGVHDVTQEWLVGASDQGVADDGDWTWVLQVHRTRTLREIILRRHPGEDDPVVAAVAEILRGAPGISGVRRHAEA